MPSETPQQRRARFKLAGLCVTCGKCPPKETFLRCQKCLDRQNAYSKDYQKRAYNGGPIREVGRPRFGSSLPGQGFILPETHLVASTPQEMSLDEAADLDREKRLAKRKPRSSQADPEKRATKSCQPGTPVPLNELKSTLISPDMFDPNENFTI